jgi:hypothetical protein
MKRDRRIGAIAVKGDPAKANAKSVLEASETVITRGDLLWRHWQHG